MIEVKKFSAVLDTDNAVSEVNPTSHIDARNVVFRGDGANKRVQNILGTTAITNSLPAGTNQEIAKHYDDVRQRIYYFNYNSLGRNGIYFYDIRANVVVPVLVCFTHSVDDILKFSLNRPIEGMQVMYGDSDILFYCDSLKKPCTVNVTQFLAVPPTTATRLDISLLKNPPHTPPIVAIADDNSVTVNNIHKGLFQFAYRFVYSYFEKSVFSGISSLPLPISTLNPATDVDPTKNSRVDITLQTGTASVIKIELMMRKSLGTTYSKWFLVDTIDKAKLSIANNSTYIYHFFNDAFYTVIDDKEASLLYDYVPDEANDVELLNGNIPIFGGIKEGLSRDVALNLTISSTPQQAGVLDSSISAWSYNSRFGIGIAYFSDEGKTNGVFIDMTQKLQTSAYNEVSGLPAIPKVNLAINSRPPIWATYYQWVRTQNSTKGSFIELTTNATFKDDKYAYISLESLYRYVEENPNVKDTQSYEFLAGDRISFLKKINSGGLTSVVLANRDYEIVGVVSDPIVQGDTPRGTFVKIALPTGLDTTFNFGQIGSSQYNNYFVEIYTPAKPLADAAINTYYEFGERYGIGDAGLTTRYHLGQIQNQTPNLSQPATFSFLKGDVYFRLRQFTIGNILRYSINAGTYDNSWFELGMPFIGQSYTDASYTPSTQVHNQLYAGQSPSNQFLLTGSAAKSFRVQTTLNFNIPTNGTTVYLFVSYGVYTITQLQTNTTPRTYLIPPQSFNEGAHSIKVDVIINVPASTRAYLLQCVPTGTGITWTSCDFVVSENLPYYQMVEDRNFADTYTSSVNSNGRPLVIDESQKETYNPTLLRWGQAYEQGTDLNQTNRFYPNDFDELDRSKGDIQRLKVRGKILRCFQNRAVARHGIYSRFIKQAGGSDSLVTTTDIITATNAQYYAGDYGLGDQYTSLVSSSSSDYFVDPVRGYQIRVSEGGLEPINEIWHGQYLIRSLLTPYNKTWTRTNGSIARIHGYFDYLENQYVTILQGGTNGGKTIADYCFGFQERSQGNPSYTSFYDFKDAEGMICAEEVSYAWKNGGLHVFNNAITNNFFGVQYDAWITVPFNQNIFQKKVYQSMSQEGNVVWPCTLIYSDTDSYVGQRQESNLVSSDFRLSLDRYQAAFLRDKNSIGSYSNGEKLKGGFLVVKFHIQNASTFAYLSLVEVKFNLQQLNPH